MMFPQPLLDFVDLALAHPTLTRHRPASKYADFPISVDFNARDLNAGGADRLNGAG
jgi:hypothetical protein